MKFRFSSLRIISSILFALLIMASLLTNMLRSSLEPPPIIHIATVEEAPVTEVVTVATPHLNGANEVLRRLSYIKPDTSNFPPNSECYITAPIVEKRGRGVVFFAFGPRAEEFVQEVEKNAQSYLRHNPALEITLATSVLGLCSSTKFSRYFTKIRTNPQ